MHQTKTKYFLRCPLICLIIAVLSFTSLRSAAQSDSVQKLADIPVKYISEINKKVDKYSDRLTSKTEKTLVKLAKWEAKIKALLQKADPAAAEKLFAPGKPTFSLMLQKLKDGKALSDGYKASYNSYTDKLTVNVQYLAAKKDSLDHRFIAPLKKAGEKLQMLDSSVAESETAAAIIKERKKELLAEAMKTLGKSKYVTKINKEAYYYAETLRNYKELFNEPGKAEALAEKILKQLPAFGKFMRENSALASLFGNRAGAGEAAQNLAGLQTRSSVNGLIQNRIAQGGPNAAAVVSQNMQAAQAELQKLKDKLMKTGSADGELPDFKPNTQKSKTFKQRLEPGSNFQFGKPNHFTKSVADIGLSLGYKLNDKSIVGIGIAYKMGYGKISRLRISHEGIGLRSFIDYKLKKQFFFSGGYEMNYNTVFTDLRTLQNKNARQSSGLIGLSKKIKIKTKFIKGTKFQLLYDMLYKTHAVASQPLVFRVGYDFK